MNGTRGVRLWLHLVLVVAAIGFLAVIGSRGSGAEFKAVQNVVNSSAGNILYYALVVASVGTVSMAMVEFIKAVGNIRRYFHEWQVRRWIRDPRALLDLLFLAIGDRGRSDALFGQPIEKMMGQVQAAANVALDFPDRYSELYRFLTTTDVQAPPVRGNVNAVAAGLPTATDRAGDDREFWHRHIAASRTRQPPPAAAAAPLATPPSPDQLDAARARIRLGNLMSRKLDAFQTRTQYYWDRSNQLAAVLLSMAVMDYALVIANNGKLPTIPVLLLGLLSGAVAPFAKDLSSALAQFGQKT
jgi:hypothetical protein